MDKTLNIIASVITSFFSIILVAINRNDNLSFYIAILMGFLSLLLFFFLLFKKSDNFKYNHKKRIEILKTHPIFYQLKKWIDFDINNIVLDDKKREWNVKNHLNIKFKTFLNGLSRVMENIKESDISYLLFYDYWHNFLYQNIELYKKESLEKGICKEYIEIFEDYHRKSELATVESIREILNNELYDDYEKIFAILDRFLWAFRETHNDLYKIIKLNGKLDLALEKWNFPYCVKEYI